MPAERLNRLVGYMRWKHEYDRHLLGPHPFIPEGTPVSFVISQGRYIVQAALKQGRVHRAKQDAWALKSIDQEYVEAGAEASRLGRHPRVSVPDGVDQWLKWLEEP